MTKISKGWHYAFVADEEFGGYDVYEMYKTTMGTSLRTESPIFHVSGWSVDEAVRGLERMINDLRKNHVFDSVEKMDSYYGVGDDT